MLRAQQKSKGVRWTQGRWTMGRRSRALLVATLGLVSCQGDGEPSERLSIVPALVAELDSTVAAYDDGDFAGAVLVGVGDSVVYTWGRDSLGVSQAATDSRFWIASITKSFTAAAIVRLQQDGALRTTQRLRAFVRGVPPDKDAITLYHLLTHTSGLADAYLALDQPDRSTMLRRVLAEPLADSVGSSYAYADDNYSLLAAVVEVAAGTSYEDYVRQTFFEPTGMENSGFWTEVDGVYPTPHPIEYVQDRDNWTFKGAGGISSTVRDLWRWSRALVDTIVVNRLGRDLLWSPHVPLSTAAYALGWNFGVRDGLLQVRSSGADDFGSNGMLGLFPELDVTVVVLAHAVGPDDETLGIELYRDISLKLQRLVDELDPAAALER